MSNYNNVSSLCTLSCALRERMMHTEPRLSNAEVITVPTVNRSLYSTDLQVLSNVNSEEEENAERKRTEYSIRNRNEIFFCCFYHSNWDREWNTEHSIYIRSMYNKKIRYDLHVFGRRIPHILCTLITTEPTLWLIHRAHVMIHSYLRVQHLEHNLSHTDSHTVFNHRGIACVQRAIENFK